MIDRGELRELVHELLRRKGLDERVGDDQALVTSGLLDSVDLLDVVAWLESRGVDLTAEPFDPDDYDTIDSMARRGER